MVTYQENIGHKFDFSNPKIYERELNSKKWLILEMKDNLSNKIQFTKSQI